MKILFVGIQGAGKSTQAKLLAEFLGLPSLSTGDIFREIREEDSKEGRIVRQIYDEGHLIDDKTTAEIVKKKLQDDKYLSGFIMDGYPRSLAQIELYDPGFDKVVYLKLSDEESKRRLLKRGRIDDQEELIDQRLKSYHEITDSILEHYKNKGIVQEIDATLSIEDVQRIIKGGNMMVVPRSNEQLKLMRESGMISAYALKKVLEATKVGVRGLELETIASEEIKKRGGRIAFSTVDDYKWATCITINEGVVHGIPNDRKLVKGDLVSIDLGAIYKGWFSDTAWSVVVGEDHDQEKNKFLSVGEEALWIGINQAITGNTVGDISSAIQEKVEKAGYSIVESLVGHGIGKSLHEDPEVPGFGHKGKGLVLETGMTLAIEVIYTQGSGKVVLEHDGWTISSEDKSLGGLFEMTVIVGEREAEVLTDWRKV